MNTFIKFGCLIGFVCAMATPVFAGEEKVMLMLGGKYCDAYLGNVQRCADESGRREDGRCQEYGGPCGGDRRIRQGEARTASHSSQRRERR